MVTALVLVTVFTTDRDPDDWLFAGYFIAAYLVFAGLQWLWTSTRQR
ncbi:hypothetical protein H9L21_12470 [Aeromicrobium senzhongii]|uniref:Uncharacterized protein n=1 Tax=Aeromicrobium senzhongii TaxID=2663859 RepID=A0ABX6SUI0_9ACTN|nr:hypothetical protein [Aeromicrobium senzhongii]MTB88807.1 hypothetical protein [Aeromicrobium senzhongii]QNL93905.1 hypothetical protein H9L21_12470 [Aeromicrobium senzhongii]